MSGTFGIGQPERIRPDWIVLAVIIALCAGMFLYFASSRQYALRESASGFDGLDLWLSSQGHSAHSFTGGWPLDRSTVGLLIQPVFDLHPDSDRTPAKNKEELLVQTDEFDQEVGLIRKKAQSVPSMIVLPKWRSGMRLTGFGHPFLIASGAKVQTVLHKFVGNEVGQVLLARQPFVEAKADDGLTARLYAAQLFEGRGCEAIVGRAGAMVLGLCPLSGDGAQDQVYVLSDPDLLNNHGLRLGDNARIAAKVLPEIAGSNRIIIDYSTRNWLTEPEQAVQRERTWEDLKRLFEPPFLSLWIGAGALLAVALWRGGVRSGPVTQEQPPLGTGKRTANRVRARLMRLTDQDGALLSDFVETRLRAQAAETFGATHKLLGSPEAAYLKFVRARRPELADRLDAVIADMRALPPHLGAAEAITHIDKFEQILEQLVDDA